MIAALERIFYVLWSQRGGGNGRDIADKLNSSTMLILFCFAVFISTKQYMGAPIQCWMPTEFKGSWEQYAEDYCFIHNTFVIPFDEEITGGDAMRSKAEIGYYQWVPIILVLQAIMFYLPNCLWTTLHRLSGLDFETIVSDAEEIRRASGEARKTGLEKLSVYLEECLEFKEQRRTPLSIFCFRIGRGAYMALLYLLVKSLYLLNVGMQLCILSRFLGLSGREWWVDSRVFPRVTLCDLEVPDVDSIKKYTLQCVLPVNTYNEKVFIFLWFWFLFVTAVIAVTLVNSSLNLLATRRETSTRQWLRRIVRESDDNPEDYRHVQGIKRFCHEALHSDGVLTLRFIEKHTNADVVRDLATTLYTHFLELANPGLMPRSWLLEGVDSKFGEKLLDEVLDKTGVKLADVSGCETAKQALEEAVILPALNPTLFQGLRQPVKGILLFGPPGNGKTLLAKAVANEGNQMFLNISASSLTSKWVGESEKTIRALFQIARNAQPSIIFIDEIDSLLTARNARESEVSRRIKTEFMVQLDGASSSADERVLIIGATNRPYELDDAILRRLPKRILVDVPDVNARAELINTILRNNNMHTGLTSRDIGWIAQATPFYSNADLVALCKEAAMVPIRKLTRSELAKARGTGTGNLQISDFIEALKAVKPSCSSRLMEELHSFAERAGQE